VHRVPINKLNKKKKKKGKREKKGEKRKKDLLFTTKKIKKYNPLLRRKTYPFLYGGFKRVNSQ
jgi:hypothetical protein